MYLDNRSKTLFQEVIKNPNITNKQLEVKYKLSRYQISYSFQKVNEWLKWKNYPEVTRSKNGRFILEPELTALFSEKETRDPSVEYLPSENERANLILLMLLTSKEELSLAHFTTKIQVSKNTILRDLKVAQKLLPKETTVTYSRASGYQLAGSEWELRKVLTQVVSSVKEMFRGEHYFLSYSGIEKVQLMEIRRTLEEAEAMMQIKFTYEQIELLPYLLSVMFLRIRDRRLIDTAFHIDEKSLSDTREYHITDILLEKTGPVPEQERLFITLQLLTTNIFSGEILTEKLTEDLEKVVLTCLDLFEKKALVSLKNKHILIEKLLLHLKPAYYRIKYQMNLEDTLYEKFNQEFEALNFIVKEAFDPLAKFIGREIPAGEIFFISLFIGSDMIPQNDIYHKQKRAIVLCPSGVTFSKIMENILVKLFPEIHFYPTISVREYAFFKAEVDIVFSSIPLKDGENVFVVQPFMNDIEKTQLRQHVLQNLFGMGNQLTSIDKIMEVVERNADIKDPNAIRDGIIDILSANTATDENKRVKKVYLHDLITEDNIMICEDVKNYQEAIRLASQPLLLQQAITANYVKTMIDNHKFHDPYIIIGEDIAIPHAMPNAGVNRLAMSLLVVKNGVYFSETEQVHFVIVIAPVDKEQHIEALYQIVHLAENHQILDDLLENVTKEKIMQTINQLVIREDE
ncbi:BglG family transcription antiterminator [Listeria monocytogenes]|nr:BglG family transcription antiterminator [Listeria monocytogenes]